MEQKNYYAHKTEDGRLQTIAEHAKGTAGLAKTFAGAFGFGDAGNAAGLFHDVGKYSPVFQARLAGSGETYEHASAGMYLFANRSGSGAQSARTDLLLAYAIAGHHAGLPDTGTPADTEDESTFQSKMKRRKAVGEDFSAYRAELGELPPLPALPDAYCGNREDRYSYQLLGRMLFSALVDADFLDTEAFMSDGQVIRDGGDPFDELAARFDRYMSRFEGKTGKLNENRAHILEECRRAAAKDGALFRLTVPTGGGKTLSSMAFALNYLRAHGKTRIIYVIPYISIIRQTVAEFETIFGEKNVLGHYSTADYHKNDPNGRSAAELAAENWDKPIIVTTNVQFFESLYANKTSVCRKLHNIANSVIIFDEAQMFPVGLLRPALRTIAELVKNYRCCAVLSTATQPALGKLLADNGMTAEEICPDYAEMYPDFTRVRYELLGTCGDDAILERLRETASALCVLNSRDTVRQYYETLRGDGVYHLTTYMTPAHLERSIRTIRERLASGKPCLVLSTSLIEAGVDMDFPTVFRELAGLDSVIQAGGRCNREGKRPVADSTVYVFRRTVSSMEEITKNAEITSRVSELYDDISSPEAIHAYFERRYMVQDRECDDTLDKHRILPLINQKESKEYPFLCYNEIARRFRYIDKEQRLVLIPNGENGELCDAVRSGKLNRNILRRVSRDSVAVFDNEFYRLNQAGVLSTECAGIAVLEDPTWYRSDCGLVFRETGEGIFQ